MTREIVVTMANKAAQDLAVLIIVAKTAVTVMAIMFRSWGRKGSISSNSSRRSRIRISKAAAVVEA